MSGADGGAGDGLAMLCEFVLVVVRVGVGAGLQLLCRFLEVVLGIWLRLGQLVLTVGFARQGLLWVTRAWLLLSDIKELVCGAFRFVSGFARSGAYDAAEMCLRRRFV